MAGWQYTIEMWAYLPATAYTEENAWHMIVGKPTGWRITINDPGQEGDIRYYHKEHEKIYAVIVEGLLPEIFDEWAHIAAVWDKTASPTQKLYIDGAVVATGNYQETTYADNNTPVGIGAKVEGPPPFSFDWYSEGRIDELRIWDIALEPQIKSATEPFPPDWSRDWDPNDANLNTFTWKPGAYAADVDGHNIYFGDSLDDVNESADPCVTDHDGNSWTHGKTFEVGKTYYWRVDEVNGLDTWTGSIWKFQTLFDIVDPNMIVWYKFNETSGIDVTDSSGHSNHGELAVFAGLHEIWDPCDGRFPGCINFDEEERIDIDDDVFDYIGDSISISVWWKEADRSGDENEFCGFGDDDLQLLVRGPDDQPDNPGVIWQAGNDSNDYLEWEVDTLAWQSNWHHLVFTKNGPEGTMKIYFDTVLVASTYDANRTSLSETADDEEDGFNIGSGSQNGDSFVGKADDFRVYDYEIPQSKIDELARGGDLESAWSPSPYDGQQDAPRDANLVWKPGDYAADHNVFFGTSWEDVNSMTDPCATKSLGNESYDLPILDLDTTYYWRVDEHNDPCTWRGPIWKFKVADYTIVDDFESYEDTSHLRTTWVDKFWNGTGAILLLANNPALYPPHSGDQIMRYQYDNRDLPAYSEAHLPLPAGKKDWTDSGVSALTLYFYGKSTNDTTDKEQMYVGIQDENAKYAEVRYGDYRGEDINDLNEPEWHDWFIALPDFNDPCYAAVPNDLDLTDVNKLYIGFGNRRSPQYGGSGVVRFDDIRLYLPTCQPHIIKPVGDFAGRGGVPDCVVDWWDIGFFVENEWLKSDANLIDIMEEPCDANLIGHWALDADPCDSSSHKHNSTIEGEYSWVTGHDYDNNPSDGAIEFETGKGRIVVDDKDVLRPKYAVTASAWVYFTEEQDDARVVVKGENGEETYLIEVDDDDTFRFRVRDVCETQWSAGTENRLYPDEWMHLAGTFDGDTNTVKAYVNAELVNQTTDANFVTAGRTLCQDTNDLAIGSRAEELTDTFEGAIDEVRVYNYALDANEIAWLATDSTGFIRLRSQANLYDLEPPGEKAVNFRDIALLIDEHWLEEKKWP
ncbi:MAG: LamG-like jellyroll fold domain-containing protein [Planctomycetota bacterium]